MELLSVIRTMHINWSNLHVLLKLMLRNLNVWHSSKPLAVIISGRSPEWRHCDLAQTSQILTQVLKFGERPVLAGLVYPGRAEYRWVMFLHHAHSWSMGRHDL